MLDPNSDNVRLAHVREGAHPLLTARYARVTNDVAVWRDGPEADRRLRLRLRLRFADLDPSTQAAVLGLDPVRDREEYAALSELLRLQKHGEPPIIDIAQLADSDLPGARALGLAGAQHRLVRLEHLGPAATLARCGAARPHGPVHGGRPGVARYGSGAAARRPGRPVDAVAVAALPRALPGRRRRGAQHLLGGSPRRGRATLHRHGGADRRGRAQVQTVPADLDATPEQGARERGVPVRQPAAHEHELGSRSDRSRQVVLVRAPGSRGRRNVVPNGQALVAGRVLPHAAYAQMGVRVSEEGGADVPAAWATPRARSSWERHRSFGFDSKMYRPRRVVASAEIRPNVAARAHLSPRRASSARLSGQRRMQR